MFGERDWQEPRAPLTPALAGALRRHRIKTTDPPNQYGLMALGPPCREQQSCSRAVHLSDKQLCVFRWLDRGYHDGEYVDDNYGHRGQQRHWKARVIKR